jgi:acetyl esterase/lipase
MLNTRNLVDPELLGGLNAIPRFDVTRETLANVRAELNSVIGPPENYARSDVTIEAREIDGPPGAPRLTVLLYRPTNRSGKLPVLLHMHGGGYIMFRADAAGPSNVRTAAEVGCLVISVEYRLAPETVAPGSLEDCYAALRWLWSHADPLGVDLERVAVGGESSGGGLAAALALLARDRGEFRLAFQWLMSPMLDDRTAITKGNNSYVGEFVWTAASNAFAWECYTGGEPGRPDVSPYIAPSRATDLRNLPATYISVGSLDLFLEEDIEYARKLLSVGNAVELHVLPRTYHGSDFVTGAQVSIISEWERRKALAKALQTELRAAGVQDAAG